MIPLAIINQLTALGFEYKNDGNMDIFSMKGLVLTMRIVHSKPMMWVETDAGNNADLIKTVADILKGEAKAAKCLNLHPDTRELLIQFTADLGQKLLKSQIKYGLDRGWRHPPSYADPGDGRFFMSEEQCNTALLNHLKKGDIIDVAAYLAFMNANGWKIDTAMFA